MKIKKIIKFVLLATCIVYFFPKFNNGIFTFVLKLFLYIFLMYICYVIINDAVNLIYKHWGKANLLWIDEREHARGNTLANITKMNFLGALFRFIHYVSFNKKRMLQEMWYGYLENIAVVLTFILVILIIVVFIFYRLNFMS